MVLPRALYLSEAGHSKDIKTARGSLQASCSTMPRLKPAFPLFGLHVSNHASTEHPEPKAVLDYKKSLKVT